MRRKHIFFFIIILLFATGFWACSGQQAIPEQDTAVQEEVVETPPETEEEQPEAEEEIVTVYTEEALLASYQERTNKALEHLLMAQIALAEGLPNSALYQVNLSLAILQTADGLAYKGSILYLLGRHDEARAFWDKAYQMDPDAIHPNLPGISEGMQ